MTDKPEALRLACLLEDIPAGGMLLYRQQAAAELRRLHEEVESMKQNISEGSRVEQSLITANTQLHDINEELLKTLCLIAKIDLRTQGIHHKFSSLIFEARAAIAKATGEQA